MSVFNFGVVKIGTKEFGSEAFYDHFTNAPKVIDVFPTDEAAQQWVEATERRESQIRLLPGRGERGIYSVVSLDDESTYRGGQNVGRGTFNLPLEKKNLIEAVIEENRRLRAEAEAEARFAKMGSKQKHERFVQLAPKVAAAAAKRVGVRVQKCNIDELSDGSFRVTFPGATPVIVKEPELV